MARQIHVFTIVMGCLCLLAYTQYIISPIAPALIPEAHLQNESHPLMITTTTTDRMPSPNQLTSHTSNPPAHRDACTPPIPPANWRSGECAALAVRLDRERLDSHRRLTGRKGRKVFVVGPNKSGTTSMGAFLAQIGLKLSHQPSFECLIEDWGSSCWSRIIQLVEGSDAFQDVPFSFPPTFAAMDTAFPGSKFILTVRDSPAAWVASARSFYSRIELDKYVGAGWSKRLGKHARRFCGGNSTAEDYWYRCQLRMVRAYFKERPDDLLEVNLNDPHAAERICGFLNTSCPVGTKMPRKNQRLDTNVTTKDLPTLQKIMAEYF